MATTNETDGQGDHPSDRTSNSISHSNRQKLHLKVQPDRSSSPSHCAQQRRPSASGLPAPSTSGYFISISVSLSSSQSLSLSVSVSVSLSSSQSLSLSLSLHLSLSLDFMSNIYLCFSVFGFMPLSSVGVFYYYYFFFRIPGVGVGVTV